MVLRVYFSLFICYALTLYLGGQKYMICNYPLENSNSFDVSFNKFNVYNNMVRPYLEFSEVNKFYNELIALAVLVWEKRSVIVAYQLIQILSLM